MIDTITNIAPQPAGVDNAGDAGKPSDSQGGASFNHILDSAVNAKQQPRKDSKEAPAKSSDDHKADIEVKADAEKSAAASSVAGAVQMAMAVPVQNTDPVPEQSAMDGGKDAAPVAAVQAGKDTQQAQSMPAVTTIPDLPVQAGANQQATNPAPSLQVTQTVPADAAVPMQAAPQQDAATAASQTAAAAQATLPASAQAQAAEVAAQGNASVEDPAADKPTNTPAVKSDKARGGETHSAHTPVHQESKTGADAVPVEWRFDSSADKSHVSITDVRTHTGTSQVDAATADSAGDASSGLGQQTSNQPAAAQAAAPFSADLKAAVQSTATTASPAVDQTKIIDQVVREVKLHRFDGHSDLIVRLDPPDMGTLRLQITQSASGLTGHIQASTDSVRGLLQANLPALMDALSGAGLRMESVSVSVNSSFNPMAQNAFQGNQQDSHQSGNGQARQRFTMDREIGAIPAMAGISYASAGGRMQAGYSWLA